MAFMKNFVIFVSLLFLAIAFWLYKPLPAEIEEPWLYRTKGVVSSFVQIASVIIGKVTGQTPLAFHKHVLSMYLPKVHHNYPELEVKDLRFEGVGVRLYKPKSVRALAPCVILIHGGGWVTHDIDTFDATSVQLALNTGMIVISVDYRLAPENVYPVPLDDCLTATKYILQNGQHHGVDVNKVAILGESTGGTLATAVALRLAEEDGQAMPPLKLQVLIYPATQVLSFRTSSYLLYKDYPVHNQRQMVFYVDSYLVRNSSSQMLSDMEKNYHITSYIRRPIYSNYFKVESIPDYVRPNPAEVVDPFDDYANEDLALRMDSLATDPYVSPLMADHLSKLPSVYILVCEFDVLRDDGLLYVHRLREANVTVELSYVKNQPHSFMTILPSSTFQFQGATGEWNKIYQFLKNNL